MTTAVFITVLALFILFAVISANNDIDSTLAGFCFFAAGVLLVLGLMIIPLAAPVKSKTKEPLLSKETYSIDKIKTGLYITVGDEYAIINDYETVSNFNDSTKLYHKIEKSFYNVEITNAIKIGDKLFDLKTLDE